MLPPLTKERIVEAMPEAYPFRYRNPLSGEVGSTSLDYDIQRYQEQFENEEGSTTAIYQETAESMVRSEDTPLTQLLDYRESEADGDLGLAAVEGERLYDEWTWTITATGQGMATTPGGQTFRTSDGNRVSRLKFELEEFFRSRHRLEQSGLYEPGDAYEVPVIPEVVSSGGDVSTMFDDQPQERRVFVVRFNYTLTRAVAVQYADRFGTEVTQQA